MPLPNVENPKLTAINPHFKNRYAPLDEVLRVLRPAFQLGWVAQQTVDAGNFVTSVFNPKGDLVNSVEFPFYVGKEDPQGLGSALTYARRYGLCLAFNIAGETDDDAEAAQGRSTNDTKQAPRRRTQRKAQ